MKTISVFGLGKLGLPYALLLAKKGLKVYGVDVNLKLIDGLTDGELPLHMIEPGLEPLFNEVRETGNFIPTTRGDTAVFASGLSVVFVPTPSELSGRFSLEYVKEALYVIGKALRSRTDPHLVSVMSTISPGSMRELDVYLQEVSGRSDIRLIYNPEFVQLGRVIHGMSFPACLLIGTKTGDFDGDFGWLDVAHRREYWCVTWEEAEITKLCLNAALSLKPTLAGVIAQLCQAYPGTNVDRVTGFIGADPRIGPRFFKAGTQPGGPCLPRDVDALAYEMEKIGVDCPLIDAIEETNDLEAHRIAEFIHRVAISHGMEDPLVALCGVAYKPKSIVLDESLALRLVEEDYGHRYIVHDPRAMALETFAALTGANYAGQLRHVVDQSDIIVLLTSDEAWQALQGMDLEGKVVIDLWRVLFPETIHCDDLIRFGVG